MPHNDNEYIELSYPNLQSKTEDCPRMVRKWTRDDRVLEDFGYRTREWAEDFAQRHGLDVRRA